MPDQETIDRAREDAREGKSPSTQAGEFVREEIHHVREGKHGARSSQQAIAIGLSALKKKAAQDEKASESPRRKVPAKRSRATEKALKREPRNSVSKPALARQAKSAAAKRGKKARSAAAIKAARTRKAA